MLNTIISGQPGDKTPLLIAHGVFGSARNWGVIAKRLGQDRQVVAVDMRNHGESEWFATQSYADMAGDLSEVIAAQGGRMDVLGHSMGGKAAMVLALQAPQAVRRLVVADIAPVAYSHTQLHLVDAMRALDLERIDNRTQAHEALRAAIPEEGVRAFLLQSLDVRNHAWRLNLDVLGREMPKIVGFPEVDGRFDPPTLFLTGADSDYVTAAYRPEIKRLFPAARFARVRGAGHWLHADKPREFEETVRAFLDA